jgi:small glutamine-rich tetratricopeptide repeat-containing protein alpha
LEKAAKRVAAQESSSGKGRSGSGFSVASEWDSKAKGGETIADADERKKIVNEQEAEKHKLKGNSHMANRNYEAAVESYSSAIKLCPKGPKSHVYYSNRAAALCYLEQYEQAESDSLRSLALDPTYEKGHSRLGLARFFMADYEGAIEAYTAALSYDPDNAASKSYLAKAKSRLHQQQGLRS